MNSSVKSPMKQGILLLFISVLIFSGCKNDKGPDVSSIKVDLEVNRFEKDFFAVDTNNIYPSLLSLAKKYPAFMPDFLTNIMGLPPVTDTSTAALGAIKIFKKNNRQIYDFSQRPFRCTHDRESEVVSALKHVRCYFPEYKLPTRLTTFIGPMDALFQGSL